MCQNVLLSYPRSGNHLCRFFIELLSEIPTFGCKGNSNDIEIFKNKFNEPIPFNIQPFDKNDCYFKYHVPPPKAKNLILIVRNPREVLLRNCDNKINLNSFNNYFNLIDFYNNHTGKKMVLFYEDILTNKVEFINKLYTFLELDNFEKKNYVISNIDKLFELSSKGKNRAWGGVNSNFHLNYYYKNITPTIKIEFDTYLNNKLENYQFLKNYYNI